MKTGIMICGLNGAGKSTLGKALAAKLDFHFIDNEDLYFPKTDPNYMYASERSREEVEVLLGDEIKAHENFIFVSVKGDYKIVEEGLAKEKSGCFAVDGINWQVVLIEIPRDIRLKRVRDRSFQKFGSRMLPGGDLQEQEENFFRFVKERDEDTVEKWLQSVGCPVIWVDGTKSVEENVDFLAGRISGSGKNHESVLR